MKNIYHLLAIALLVICSSTYSKESIELIDAPIDMQLIDLDNNEIKIHQSQSELLKTLNISYYDQFSEQMIYASLTKANNFKLNKGDIKDAGNSGDYTMTITLEKGQLIFTNDTVTILTLNHVETMAIDSFSDLNKSSDNQDFYWAYVDLTYEVDLNALNDIIIQAASQKGCGSSMLWLASANLGLAAALAATYATAGIAAATIGAASLNVAAAAAAVSSDCRFFEEEK